MSAERFINNYKVHFLRNYKDTTAVTERYLVVIFSLYFELR